MQNPCECAKCNHSPEDVEAMVAEGIAKMGFIIVPVFDDKPPFVYTIGLTETFKHPEFIIIGNIDLKQMIDIVGTCAEKVKTSLTHFVGKDEVHGVITYNVNGKSVDGPTGCRTIKKQNHTEYMGQACDRYGKDNFTAKQIVIAGPDGRLPCDENADPEWVVKANQIKLY
jgi:hypothetical protein